MEHNSSYGYLTDCREVPITFPPQHQDRQPGFEYVMEPKPASECGKACRKLEGKTALITGGDSGIGRAVAYDFVRQGADVVIAYYDEDRDAERSDQNSACLITSHIAFADRRKVCGLARAFPGNQRDE